MNCLCSRSIDCGSTGLAHRGTERVIFNETTHPGRRQTRYRASVHLWFLSTTEITMNVGVVGIMCEVDGSHVMQFATS